MGYEYPRDLDKNPPSLRLGWTIREVIGLHVGWFESEVVSNAVVDGEEQDWNYTDPLLEVFLHGGDPLPACREVIEKIRMSGLKEHHKANAGRKFRDLWAFLKSPDRVLLHLSDMTEATGMSPASMAED